MEDDIAPKIDEKAEVNFALPQTDQSEELEDWRELLGQLLNIFNQPGFKFPEEFRFFLKYNGQKYQFPPRHRKSHAKAKSKDNSSEKVDCVDCQGTYDRYDGW